MPEVALGDGDADTAYISLRPAARFEHERVCTKRQRLCELVRRHDAAGHEAGSTIGMAKAATS